ncbi:MAG: hypothetical protein M0D55_15620 [Elusimicrobiota bacterium]|nr:MAG: hypothetical protein M0D55_15620 [Elusimicrobiota bacterium]
MDEEEIAKDVAKKLGIPYACFANRILKMQDGQHLESIIPENFARDNLVMPLFLDGETLAVAMAEPSKQLTDLVRLISGQAIQPFVSSKTQLLTAIDRFYP